MENSWPKITIVTPSYNQAAYLSATIESVLTQGYPNLEYIVMDGGSTDGSADIIRRYERQLSGWVSEPDHGQADAVRKGFARSTGTILSFLNSDDLLAPGALHRVAAHFERRLDLGVLVGAGGMLDAGGRFLYGTYPMGWGVAELLSCESRFMQPAVFYRRLAYDQVGGINSQFRFCLDLDLFVRLAAAYTAYEITYERLAFTRLHPETKTANWQDIAAQEIARIGARYPHAHPVGVLQRLRSFNWRTRHFILRCAREGTLRAFSNRSRSSITSAQQR